jgi:hypothetical protein
MATFKIEQSDYINVKKGTSAKKLVKKAAFNAFNESILGLGTIESKSKQVNALSVIFDLEGFTDFCKQIDPQLAISEYLGEFLKWIFAQIRKEIINKESDEGYETYCSLPFLSKYLGDGVLFLWDTEGMSDTNIMNVVVSMKIICQNYKSDFLLKISKRVSSPPKKLRCGIARGAIYSVGNGNDFVGPCINMSARLQKLNSLSFCFSRRGFIYEVNPDMEKEVLVKKVNIRGIGSEELVCVLRNEFVALEESDKEKFMDI